MRIDELQLFGMVEDRVQERFAFRLRHVDDADSHEAIHVYRFAPSFVVGPKNRMRRLTEGGDFCDDRRAE